MVVYEDEEANRTFMKKLPIGRWGKPDEIAGLTTVLLAANVGKTRLIDNTLVSG